MATSVIHAPTAAPTPVWEPTHRWRDLTIVAQDPGVRERGRALTAEVRIPYERLEPGPWGHRFRVVDYDPQQRVLGEPTVIGKGIPVPDDLTALDGAARDFHAQNVYAIAARTLLAFESALGRRVRWSFGGHELYLIPHAIEEANAFYSEDDHAIYFGYFNGPEGRVFTCLSHDVIAHETTHAIFDGLRDRFDTPGLPDQTAFHEAFADIVALLSAFGTPELVATRLGKADSYGRIPAKRVTPDALERAVGAVAEQIGRSLYGHTAIGLRSSFDLWKKPPRWREGERDAEEFAEPHRRGEIVVAALLGALIGIWSRRIEALLDRPEERARRADGGERTLDRVRAAEEGALAAEHLLKMCIRAIDYVPPLEFEFVDLLDAILVSDEDLEPDDKLDYRVEITDAFKKVGIERPKQLIDDLAGARQGEFTYFGFNHARLQSDPDEIFRFIWENRVPLGIELDLYTELENVRVVTRLGADGFVVNELFVDYVQRLADVPARIATKLGMPSVPDGLPDDKAVGLFGGGVIVFDQFGRAKLHQHKRLLERDRQERRLRHLVTLGIADDKKRFGSGTGAPRGQRFAETHLQDAMRGERW